jgi:hypothetical protein
MTGHHLRFAPGIARLSVSDRAQPTCEIAHLTPGHVPNATL